MSRFTARITKVGEAPKEQEFDSNTSAFLEIWPALMAGGILQKTRPGSLGYWTKDSVWLGLLSGMEVSDSDGCLYEICRTEQ